MLQPAQQISGRVCKCCRQVKKPNHFRWYYKGELYCSEECRDRMLIESLRPKTQLPFPREPSE